MILLYQKIKELGLGRLYAYVLQNNPSRNLPYHGNSHMEMVAWVSTLGGIYYGLTDQELKELITAALFHDWDHTGSGKNDDLNIENAIRGYSNYALTVNGSTSITDEMLNVIDLIKATRFPYIQECNTLTISQQILRDADILQGLYCQNYINGVVLWATQTAKNKLPDVLTKVNIIKEFFNEDSINK